MKELLHSPVIKLLFIAIILQPCYLQIAPEEEVCRFFPNNTKIRDPDSSNQYITCVDFISHYTKCPASTPFYDKDSEECVQSMNDHSIWEISCTDAAGQFIPDPKSCKGYYYCHDEELAVNGKCPDNTHFDVETKSCVFEYDSKCDMNQFQICSIVRDGINFRDGTHCGNYFVCQEGVLIPQSCYLEYFNPITGICEQKLKVNCLKHPIPSGVCWQVNRMVNDQATCRGYFYCGAHPDAEPKWYQCPAGTFFNEEEQSCSHPSDTACTWDRCEGRGLAFVSSATKGCRHYWVCNNGISVAENSCGNKFFDEAQGVCTSTIIKNPLCQI